MSEPESRRKRFPQIGIRLNQKDFSDLWDAAGRQRFRRTDGTTEPGRLLRALVSVVWPWFRRANYEVRPLEDLLEGIEPGDKRIEEAKDWLYRLYQHMPARSRKDIMRGIADTYRFKLSMPEAMDDESEEESRHLEGLRKGQPPRTGRFGNR